MNELLVSQKHHINKKHAYAILGILLLGAGTFSYYINMKPFAQDDMYAISFGTLRTPLSFITENWVEWVPGYRPVSSLTFWLQYQLVGIEPISYYIFNILIFLGCVVGIYFLIYLITKSSLCSFFSAILFMVDFRIATSLYWIIERQNPLAVIFGVSGIVLFLYSTGTKKVKQAAKWIYLLLLLSALSKEFGLAFVGFFATLGILLHRKYWKTIVIIVLAVGVTYFGLRFGIVKSSPSINYCEEEIGFKDKTLSLCYNDYEPRIRLNFFLWNVSASFFGTFIPDMFSNEGQWIGINYDPGIHVIWGPDVSTTELIYIVVITILVGVGIWKFPKESVSFLSLVIFNSMLSFLLYRGRNQLVGMVGVYGMVGLGLNYFRMQYLRRKRYGYIFIFLVVFLTFSVILKATSLSNSLYTIAYGYSNTDPCETISNFPHVEAYDMEIIKKLKTKYKMSNPECLESGWKTWRLRDPRITK